MKNTLKFILETNKLKEIPRTGLVWLGVKDPETIAEHTFQVAMNSWILGTSKRLDIEKLIKIAISHDLCEVHAGDMTPFWDLVQKDKNKVLKRWVRISIKKKEKRKKKKFEKEKKALLKLINNLKTGAKREILALWIDYEKWNSPEGRFFKQIDQMTGMIEALESLKVKRRIWITPWWEEAEELVDDPLLIDFLRAIQKKFYGSVPGSYKKNKGLENILDFFFEIGKLKKMPRTIWVSLGAKQPETVASHCFAVALLALVLGEGRKNLNMEKLLKMALCHEIAAVHTEDLITPYSNDLPENKRDRRRVFKKWPRLSREEKRGKFLKAYKEEKIALQKLTSKLDPSLKKEIIQLWDEYKNTSTPEAHFVNQLNVIAVLLQALQYKEKYKTLPTDWVWEWALEKCHYPQILELLEEIKEKFYKKS